MNKKGTDWLNVMGLFMLAISLVVAVFFINFAKTGEVSKAEGKILQIQTEYKNLQTLRTFIQIPMEVKGTPMTFSKAVNTYFELY